MIPISDSTPRRTFPFVNYLIVALNIYIFVVQLGSGDFEGFIRSHAFVSAYFNILDPSSYLAILYSTFMHGGFLHIVSNMWFLHIFGDNVEDKLGHLQYAVFYILAGLASALGQYLIDPTNTVPMIGASGAISGVAGAYFVYFRKSTVKTLVPIFLFISIIDLPTWFFLGYWFLIQIFSGVGSLVSFDLQHGGIAWFAHVGGFVFGYLVAKVLTAYSLKRTI